MNMDFFGKAIDCFLFLLGVLIDIEWKKNEFTKSRILIISILIILIIALLVRSLFP